MKNKSNHTYHYIQNGGLIQAQISSIEDVLNLKDLDPKLWTALACPVKGLEFNTEILEILDSDHNGRVRVPEILNAVEFIKKYFSQPQIIMEPGCTIPLEALSSNPFDCGKSPLEAAKAILAEIGKSDLTEISLSELKEASDALSKKSTTQNNLIKNECINNKDAAEIFLKLKDKIDEYFLQCSLIKYDENAKTVLKNQNDNYYANNALELLPLQICESNRPLKFTEGFNPVYENDFSQFHKSVLNPLFGEISELSEETWRRIKNEFANLDTWEKATPDDTLLQACNELKKMILYRQYFVELLKNFVSFENFYSLDKKAIFQAGTLFIDGRSCELCFKVLDIAKHGTMAALSQCFLIYCDCTKKGNSDEKMQIAALISNGKTDNLIVGRNGVFFDRQGNDWDATIVKIINNPVSIKQAFWAPYKKLMRLIQEKLSKASTTAETKVFDKMNKVVEDPKAAASNIPTKKTDIGTVAALSVAFTGIATVAGAILQAFWKLGYWIPLGIAGIILIISLPSMIIAWSKLKQRNIAPVLDASGWAINGNAKISTVLGSTLTHIPRKPAKAVLAKKDIFADKKFPWKRILLVIILIGLVVAGFIYKEKTISLFNWVTKIFRK